MIYTYLKKLTNFKNIKNTTVLFLRIREKHRLIKLVCLNKEQVLSFKFAGKILRFNIRRIDDLAILFEIFFEKIYPLEKLNKPSVIIDAGAHIGLFAILAKVMLPNTIVYSLEPDPDNFKTLEKNLELNGLKNRDAGLNIYNLGLAQKAGQKDMYSDGCSYNNSLVEDPRLKKVSTAEFINLNQFISDKKIDKIDLLKMDIEGSEYEVLYDLTEQNLAKVQSMFMEIHDTGDRNKLVEFLRSKFPGFDNDRMVYYFHK